MILGETALKVPRNRPPGSSLLWIAAWIAALVATFYAAPDPAYAVRWPWSRNAPWPSTSKTAVQPLAHPDLERRVADRAAAGIADGPVTFAVFGDQRALADGEWQALVAEVARVDAEETDIDAVLDTGDIVSDGAFSDQFALLHEILAPIRHLPYLGNPIWCNFFALRWLGNQFFRFGALLLRQRLKPEQRIILLR